MPCKEIPSHNKTIATSGIINRVTFSRCHDIEPLTLWFNKGKVFKELREENVSKGNKAKPKWQTYKVNFKTKLKYSISFCCITCKMPNISRKVRKLQYWKIFVITFSFNPNTKKNSTLTFPEKRCALKPISSLTLACVHQELLNPFHSRTSRPYTNS